VVQSTPALYDAVMYIGPAQPQGGYLKGILPPSEAVPPEPLRRLRSGSFTDWNDARGFPPAILGWRLAERTGMKVGAVVRIMSPRGESTPIGPKLVEHRFRVIGTFDTGFYDFDLNWGFTSMAAVQKVLNLPDVANAVEMTIADVHRAPEIAKEAEKLAGPKLESEHWMAQNKQFLTALQLERIVVIFVIGLFQMAAALSIVISLTMITMQKQRDIGILMSMGSGRSCVGRIFIWQGALIGLLGTLIGLALGYALCWFANTYELIELEESLYSIRFVPFVAKAADGLWISLASIAVSLLATLYPARTAARIAPAVALRYE
jgi:lipoprotein-releasing system permease protein